MKVVPNGSGRAPRSRGKVPKVVAGGRYRRPTRDDGTRGRHRGLVRKPLRNFAIGTGVFMLLAFMGVAGVVAWYWNNVQLDTDNVVNDNAKARVSVVFARDGQTEIGRLAEVERFPIDGAQIPPHVRNMFVVAEDKTFYKNQGISVPGILRAAWTNLSSGDVNRAGGSTITQQYVRNTLLDSRARSYDRKMKESVLAIKATRELGKDELLTRYLNNVPFGRSTVGIEAAARTYFGVSAKDLTVEQAAVLAGIVPRPHGWDPTGPNAAQAERRWNIVLNEAVSEGYVDSGKRAAMVYPQSQPVKPKATYQGPNGYIMKAVEDELEVNGITDSERRKQGLRITTSIDPKMQDEAWKAVHNNQVFPSEKRPETIKAALITVDPSSGEIRAMYAGEDYTTNSFNNALQGSTQAGSTWKPFTLIGALRKGYSLKSTVDGKNGYPVRGAKDADGKPLTLDNYGQTNYGTMDLVSATAKSVNTAFLRLNEEIGPEETSKVADALGVVGLPGDVKDKDGKPQAFVGNTLGTATVKPVEMAGAYAVLASGGVKRTPHFLVEVKHDDGRLRFKPEIKSQQVLDKEVVNDATYAMQAVTESGTASNWKSRRMSDREVAGKTGTTNESRGAWFVGYTPQLATAVALWNDVKDDKGRPVQAPLDDWRSRGDRVTGGSYPAAIWFTYMAEVHKGLPRLKFPDPAYIGKVKSVDGATSTSTTTKSKSPTSTTGTATSTGTATTTKPATTKPTPTLVNPTADPTNGGPGQPKPTKPTTTATRPSKPTWPGPGGPDPGPGVPNPPGDN